MTQSQTRAAIKLRFGVEIEVCTIGKSGIPHKNWLSAANEISEHLNKADLDHTVDEDRPMKENYYKWSITPDMSIDINGDRNQHGMEFVSPISILHQPTNWEPDLNKLWLAVNKNFHIEINSTCATHIHISPIINGRDDGIWSMEVLKCIGKAIMFFEHSIDLVLPKNRRDSMWASSNRHNRKVKGKTLQTIFDMVDGTTTRKDFATLMCRDEEEEEEIINSWFRWNFFPVVYGRKGTIEFRQPPGSTNEHETKRWILFATSFVQAAILSGDTLKAENEPTDLKVLHEFLRTGATANGVADTTLLDDLFDGNVTFHKGEVASTKSGLTGADVAALKKRSRENSPGSDSAMSDKFKEYYESKKP